MSVKIVTWDVETTPIVAYTWGLYGHDIQPTNIIEDRQLLSICWKVLGEKRVHGATVSDTKDEATIVDEFRQAVEDVDILVHHNGDKFDIKHFTAKLIEYSNAPLPKLNTVDTLKEVRKIAKFSSNRLDFLCGKLLGDRKKETNMQLWKDCMKRDPKALAKMEAYCKHDVALTEQLYLLLRPYMKNHPNIADNDTMNCPRCNCAIGHVRKVYRTKAGVERAHVYCSACSAPYTISAAKANRPLSSV